MSDRLPHTFQTTHWTQVVAARGDSPEARLALRELCETYYEPVAMFIRRSRDEFPQGPDNARDLTHAFFANLLEGHSLDHVDRTRGRFRSYLLGAVKHFLADQRDRDRALKRGGDVATRSLSNAPDDDGAGQPVQEIPDQSGLPADAYFDRQWGLTVIQQAMVTLRNEAEQAQELTRFEALHPWFITSTGQETAVATARSLNLSEGAFKVAVHRLRKRFRQIVMQRIAATVEDPNLVQEELNYLIQAVSQSYQ